MEHTKYHSDAHPDYYCYYHNIHCLTSTGIALIVEISVPDIAGRTEGGYIPFSAQFIPRTKSSFAPINSTGTRQGVHILTLGSPISSYHADLISAK